MVVYLDLVMGLNFVVDFLLLTGTNRMAGYPPDWRRAMIGALLGGLYGGACLLPGFLFLGNFMWRAVSLGLISLLAFGLGPGTFRRSVLFTLLSMALGGIVLILGSGGILSLLAAAGALCIMCVLGCGTGVGERRFVPVQLQFAGKQIELTALHDTGNTLRDPVTGERVLVVGPDAAKLLLGLERSALRDPAHTLVRGKIPGLRLIPYRTVGNSNGMLLGIRIANARINGRCGAVLTAFSPEGLGQGEFSALIGGTV